MVARLETLDLVLEDIGVPLPHEKFRGQDFKVALGEAAADDLCAAVGDYRGQEARVVGDLTERLADENETDAKLRTLVQKDLNDAGVVGQEVLRFIEDEI